MTNKLTFTIDGVTVEARAGQTILEAATAAGIYIPHLCYSRELKPYGSCRVCTVRVNGRPQAACTQTVVQGMVVENDTRELLEMRRSIVDMLFVEGNHFCPFCEKSGNCELQAMAYRLGILVPKHPYLFENKELDATHPDVLIERNRCILCGRCVTASKDKDGKTALSFTGRGFAKRLAADSVAGLGKTSLAVTDRAADVCPVGALVKKRTAYATPIGQRKFDEKPIGSEIEQPRRPAGKE